MVITEGQQNTGRDHSPCPRLLTEIKHFINPSVWRVKYINKLTSFTMFSVDNQLLEASLSASMKKISLPEINKMNLVIYQKD